MRLTRWDWWRREMQTILKVIALVLVGYIVVVVLTGMISC